MFSGVLRRLRGGGRAPSWQRPASPTRHAQARQSGWFAEQTSHQQRVTGTYVNRQYGFSVTVPASASAWRTVAPNPNHGLTFILGLHRTIDVSASYDAVLAGSADAALDNSVQYAGAGRVVRSQRQLSGGTAEKAVIYGKNVQVLIVQYLPLEPHNAIVYGISLMTTPAAEAADRRTLEQILSTYRRIKPEQG